MKQIAENTAQAFDIIRKGDKVMAISGSYKGQTGTVISRAGDYVKVTGFNMKKKHVKKSQQNSSGQILDIESPIHASKLALCTATNKPVKIRKKINKSGEKELYYVDDSKEVVHRNIKKSA